MSTNVIKVHFNSRSKFASAWLQAATLYAAPSSWGGKATPPPPQKKNPTQPSQLNHNYTSCQHTHLAMMKHRQTHKVKTTPGFMRNIRLRSTGQDDLPASGLRLRPYSAIWTAIYLVLLSTHTLYYKPHVTFHSCNAFSIHLKHSHSTDNLKITN